MLQTLGRNLPFIKFYRKYSQVSHKILYNMNTAYFRHNLGEEAVQINFRYRNPEFGIDRDFNFNRNVTEKIEVCIERMKINIEKEFGKKLKKKKPKKNLPVAGTATATECQPQITVQLLKDGTILNEITFAEILAQTDSRDLVLKIVNEDFQVSYNAPSVINLVLPTSILAGFFVYPSKVELQFANRNDSKFLWMRGRMPKSNDVHKIQWTEICEDFTYRTTTEDIGYHLKIRCVPSNGGVNGPAAEYISKCGVLAGPGICPFESRHVFTEKLTGKNFRMMSYNILADLYADSDYTRKELFPYCPAYALNIDYRKQLMIKEIFGYNSDVICLQEVDVKIFDLDLEPIFGFKSYSGTFQRKGTTAEGLATFYDNRRFQLLARYGINIGENIPELPIFRELYKKIQDNEKLLQRIKDRSTAVQVTVLRSLETDNVLIVANTHLYFHPDADHIRLLQIGFAMLYIEDIYLNSLKGLGIAQDKLSIVFCGDFNSTPECGIYKLMTERFVPENFVDWINQEEAVKNVSLQQPFHMLSACGTPAYTNFTKDFQACIDYIFYQSDWLEVGEVIPFPSHEELTAHVAIPSVVFPTDHVALVVNMKWK